MNVSIVGTGYVGLVTGACFSELGMNVVCVDPDSRKINQLIYGKMPMYEPGLDDMVSRNVNSGRLYFTSEYTKDFDTADIVVCALDAQLSPDGSTDITPVLNVAKTFGQRISKYAVFIIKSTVPVGTAHQAKRIIEQELADRKSNVEFDIVANPDFLTEGNAIKDFMSPDRIVIGVETDRGREAMSRLYHPIIYRRYNRVIYTDCNTAEMIKYAATAMLATRVSFMNEIANLCEMVGADINTVRHGVGTDSRIGPKYIYPGCGYGGTLFPQDIKDLIKIAEGRGYKMQVLSAVDSVNARQKQVVFEKLKAYYKGDLAGKTVAVWGLSFKPETDDMSGAPSIETLNLLTEAGCKVRVFDPVAMNATKLQWGDVYCGIDMYDAVKGADALLLLTEWRQFRMPAWERLKEFMRTPFIIDGRNIYDPVELKELGFEYRCIGIGEPVDEDA